METLTPPLTARHTVIRLATDRPTQFIDLTDRLETLAAQAGIRAGLLNVQTRHTTTAIVVNEHEPHLLTDVAALLERLAPAAAVYQHDEALERTAYVIAGEPLNGHAHCRAFLLGTSAAINVADGRLQLGRWQRVFLVELDGPRDREVSVLLLGAGQ